MERIALGLENEIKDAPAVAITDAANFQQLYIVETGGEPTILRLKVGAGGAVGSFRLTVAATIGGTHKPIRTNSDFDTATTDVRVIYAPTSPPALGSLAAGAEILLFIAGIAAEIGIECKKATTDTELTLLEGRNL